MQAKIDSGNVISARFSKVINFIERHPNATYWQKSRIREATRNLVAGGEVYSAADYDFIREMYQADEIENLRLFPFAQEGTRHLKNNGILRERVSVIYAWIKEHADHY